MNHDDRLAFKTEEVARLLQVESRTVRNLLVKGKLRGLRIGRIWRVPRQALDEYLRGPVPELPVDPARMKRLLRIEETWELLKELKRAGIKIESKGSQLLWRGTIEDAQLSVELEASIRRHCAGLLLVADERHD